MANERPLVSQYLEHISGDALAQYQVVVRDLVRRRSGVYALYRRDKLYYVGLASNLRNRLKHHLRDKHQGKWDRFSVYLTIGDSHIKELESLVLRIVRPTGNTQGGKFKKAENLRRTLAREMRRLYRRELDDLLGKMNRDLAERKSRQDSSGRRPPLFRYLSRFRMPRRLKATFRGKQYRARVRKNGQIRVKKRTYNSPSLAAHAVTRRPTNGWDFWTYERAPHDWVQLKELRR
jgi:hypothetical protein